MAWFILTQELATWEFEAQFTTPPFHFGRPTRQSSEFIACHRQTPSYKPVPELEIVQIILSDH